MSQKFFEQPAKAWSWVQASRPPSQVYIFLPLLLGQLLTVAHGYPFSWISFLLCHLYGLFCQLYIVFANDAADVVTDRCNTTFTLFSGGSRVLVENKLSTKMLMSAATGSALLCLIIGLIIGFISGKWLPLLLIIIGIMLFWSYSFPPLSLSYRGGGEFLQMVGVGLVLPLTGFYVQSGDLQTFPWPVTILTMLLALTCAMSTALPDEPSDRKCRKKTSAVILGVAKSQKIILCLNIFSIVLLITLPIVAVSFWHRIIMAIACLMILLPGFYMLDCRPGSACLSRFVALNVAFSLCPLLALCFIWLLA